ncbi:GroES-like protein [Zopfia rhizophila CBS 207.26]|uniref:GroES-like protein n=1 Tax=Zopfia rhizophila CBS 207.26 TaxID=1314779 RepID=A0A6A6DUL9_9PEZI|nr:GroES-like protein [Zopfia rhizophila CBS 207.26]
MSANGTAKSMKAIVWEGKPFQMAVKYQPMPKVEDPNDVVVRITTAAICGTDLHTYRGLSGSKNPPWIMGHESLVLSLGIVSQLEESTAVTAIIVSAASKAIDDFGVDLGGTQAQYIRAPFADSSCFKLPPGTEHDLDYVLICDIFPTAWYALDCSGFQPGDSVAVFGAGPVGLLCAYSAILRGASKVYSIDYVQSRLKKAASIGAIPINFTEGDPVTQILAREPRGVRRSCDCVGFECLNNELEPQEDVVLKNCINVTEPTGGIGLIGEYLPPTGPTPGAPLSTGKEGIFPVPIGLLWTKSLSINGGIAEIRRLQPILQDLIESGRAKPSFVIDEILHSLHDVPDAYKRFVARQIGKPVIHLPHPNSDLDQRGDGVTNGDVTSQDLSI